MSNVHKAPKGVIKVSAEVDRNVIVDISITGDFFMVPEDSLVFLEVALRGGELNPQFVNGALDELYARGVVTPMVSKRDFVSAILGVKSETKAD